MPGTCVKQMLGHFNYILSFLGGGVLLFCYQEIVYLFYPNAVYQISISYYVVTVGGRVCKPILVFRFGQAEQNLGQIV